MLCSVPVFGMFADIQGRMLFSSVFSITERRNMDLYEMPLSMSLLGFGVGTMLANFYRCTVVNVMVYHCIACVAHVDLVVLCVACL